MAKKIQFEFDIDGKPIDVIIDKTLNLKQQFRELTKEINKTQEGTREFELLSTKIGDVKDKMETTTAKSRDLFGSLSLLPGPVGMFANSVDGAIGSLKLFSSFNMKDLKFQLGETLNDFKDIASNIGKATGITKIYTVLNNALAKSFAAVGVGEEAAAVGAKGFAAALTATGVGAIVVAIGLLVSKLMEYADQADKTAEAQKTLNEEMAKGAQAGTDAAIKFLNQSEKLDVQRAKNAGATEAQIQAIREKYAKSRETQLQKNLEALQKIQGADTNKAADALYDEQQANLQQKEEYNGQVIEKEKAKNQKLLEKNKQYQEQVRQDNKTADQTLLDLKRENAALAIQDQRKREDQELENQKLAEEDKIKALKISEEKKKEILAQIATKYSAKQTIINNKRGEDDLKEAKEWADKLEELRINAIKNQQEREKEELKRGYNKTKEDLDKALADKKISQDQYNTAILNAQTALNNGIQAINDEATKKEKEDDQKKLDDKLKFLQIKGEALRAGTQEYYDNQIAILNAAEQRELADTTLTEETKLAIEAKYKKLREDLRDEEQRTKLGQVGQIIGQLGQFSSALASSYDEEAKTSKSAFEKRKKLQRQSAIIGGASAIVNVLAAPPVGNVVLDGILKGLQIGFVTYTTAEQIRKIDDTKFEGGGDSQSGGANIANLGKNYGDGGLIEGPRHAQGGMMVNAEGGEAIMTRGAVTMFAPLLSTLNQMGGGTSFSKGAAGQASYDAPTSKGSLSEPMIMKTYVVSNELTTEAEKQARLKDLSTL